VQLRWNSTLLSASADLVGIDLRKTAAVFVLGTLALTGCSSGGGKSDKLPDTVNLGVLVTLSGSDPAQNTEGQARLQGAQLAAELLNSSSGDVKLPAKLGKTKIRITSQDTRGDSNGGADAANRLTAATGENRITGIISADSADVTAIAAPHAQVAGVPLLTAVATDGFLTQLSQTILYRTVPTDDVLVATAFRLERQVSRALHPKVGVLTNGTNDVVQAINDQAANDGDVTSINQVNGGNFNGAAHTLLNNHPNVVFAVAETASDANAMTDALGGADVPAIFGMGPGFTDPDYRNNSGAAVLRPVAWSPDSATHNKLGQAVATAYQHRFNKPMTATAAETFTATVVLATAIGRAHSTNPGRVTGALADLTLDGLQLPTPWAGVQFDDMHENTRAGAVIEQVHGDTAQVVYPPEIATTQPPSTVTLTAAVRSGRSTGGSFRVTPASWSSSP
jgi:branched-chain amino acid transport system substrate-binding protein